MIPIFKLAMLFLEIKVYKKKISIWKKHSANKLKKIVF